MAGAGSGFLAEEDEGRVDRKTSKCQACHKDETEKHRLHPWPEWYEVRREIPEVFRKCEQKARTSKKEWKWQRDIVTHPLSRNQ